MPTPYPENTIWFVKASGSNPKNGTSTGSAVAIRLRKAGKPDTVKTYLLTCAHVLRNQSQQNLPVIHAWPPGIGFDQAAGLRMRIVGEIQELPDEGVLPDAHNDWVILEFLVSGAEADKDRDEKANKYSNTTDAIGYWIEADLSGRSRICGYPAGTRSFGQKNIVRPTSTESFPIQDQQGAAFTLNGDGTRAGISGGGVFEESSESLIFEMEHEFAGIHRGRDDGALQLQGVSGKYILERLREQNYERPSRSSRRRRFKTWVKYATAVVMGVFVAVPAVKWFSSPPPPRVVNHLPDDQTENVDRNSTIIVQFNHAVTVSGASLTLSQHSQESSSPPETIKLDPVVVEGVKVSDTLQFQTTWLGCKTTYTATLDGIVDARGRSSPPKTWTFTTQDGDCKPPAVNWKYPEKPDEVTMRPTIAVRFDEAVTLRDFKLDERAPDGTMTPVKLDGFKYDDQNFTLEAKPVARLIVDKAYQVTVPAAKDLSNNTMAEPYTWDFQPPARGEISFREFIDEIDKPGASIAEIQKAYKGKRVCWEGKLAKEPEIHDQLLDLVDGCKPNEPTRHHATWEWNPVTDFPPFLHSGAVVRLEGTIKDVSTLGISLRDAEPCDGH